MRKAISYQSPALRSEILGSKTFKLLLILLLLVICYLSLFTSPTQADFHDDKFLGVNMHGLVTKDAARTSHILNYLSNSCGTNMIRVFYTSDEGNIDDLQKTLDLGSQYGVRFIVVLADYPNRPNALLPFTQEENPTGWYRDLHQRYKTHVENVVTKFKNHPAIYAWELANEPHCNGHSECVDPYHNWVNSISSLIRSIDSTHRVSIGTMARRNIDLGDNVESISNIPAQYERNNALSSVSALTGHYYSDNLESERSFMLKDLAVAKRLNKPFYIGEAGLICDPSAENCTLASSQREQQRAQLLERELDQLFDADTTGYLIWQYSDRKNSWVENDPYSFFEGDPMCMVMKTKAEELGITKKSNCKPGAPGYNSHECAIKHMLVTAPDQIVSNLEPAEENLFQSILSWLQKFLNVFAFTVNERGMYATNADFKNQLEIPEQAALNTGNIIDQTGQNVSSNVTTGGQAEGVGIMERTFPTELRELKQDKEESCDFEKMYEKGNFPDNITPITQSGCENIKFLPF